MKKLILLALLIPEVALALDPSCLTNLDYIYRKNELCEIEQPDHICCEDYVKPTPPPPEPVDCEQCAVQCVTPELEVVEAAACPACDECPALPTIDLKATPAVICEPQEHITQTGFAYPLPETVDNCYCDYAYPRDGLLQSSYFNEICKKERNLAHWKYSTETIQAFQAALVVCQQELFLAKPPLILPLGLSKFLWKPVSDSYGGNLVVLLSPEVDSVIAFGPNGSQRLVNYGASNGYAQTWRGTRPGCGFGTKYVAALIQRGEEEALVEIGNGCERQTSF